MPESRRTPGEIATRFGLDCRGDDQPVIASIGTLASAWVRRYAGLEGTGFVRVPPDDLMTMFLAAEYRPGK